MKRRDFLRNTAALIAAPVYIPIERLDKIYIPAKKIIKLNRMIGHPSGLGEGDIFTISGVHDVSKEDSGQLQRFIVRENEFEIFFDPPMKVHMGIMDQIFTP
jgi:hypothetical protein